MRFKSGAPHTSRKYQRGFIGYSGNEKKPPVSEEKGDVSAVHRWICLRLEGRFCYSLVQRFYWIDFGSCLFPFILMMMMIYGVLLHSSDLGHGRAQAANPCTSKHFSFFLYIQPKKNILIIFCRISSSSSCISEVHFRKHRNWTQNFFSVHSS